MEWIRCTDRLPEAEGQYFVCASSRDKRKPYYASAWWDAEHNRWSLVPDYWAKHITHWMKPVAPEA